MKENSINLVNQSDGSERSEILQVFYPSKKNNANIRDIHGFAIDCENSCVLNRIQS